MAGLLGLDAAVEAVYRCLLMNPKSGVTEVTRLLGLTQEQVRYTLSALSELALVRPSSSSPSDLHVVNPEVGLELLLARQQAELVAQQHRVETSRAAVAQLLCEYQAAHGSINQGIEHLSSVDAVRDRLKIMSDRVKKEVLTFAPGGAQTELNMRASRPLNEALLNRGVRLRTIYLDSFRNHGPTIEHVNWFRENGGEVRTVTSLPTRMIIFDRSFAFMAINDDNISEGAVALSSKGILAALCSLFEKTWASGQALDNQPRRCRIPDRNMISRQEITFVRLLAEGFTDDAIAKRLGVSARTARRIASELMDRLGARSRFQAGVNAVRQGWLPLEI